MGSYSPKSRALWCVSYIALYTALFNTPYWAASSALGLMALGWFCLEFAVIGLLALFLPRAMTALLLLLAMGADLVCGLSKTYYLAPSECIAHAGSLAALAPLRVLEISCIFVLSLLLVTCAALFPTGALAPRGRLAAALVLGAFVLWGVTTDCWVIYRETGRLPIPFQGARPSDINRFTSQGNLWIGRYPVFRLSRDQAMFGTRKLPPNGMNGGGITVPSATSIALSKAGLPRDTHSGQRPNVLLIVVESWGLANDQAIREAILEPYFQPRIEERYQIIQGSVPFFGSTVPGETRELCSSRLGFAVEDAGASQLKDCVPSQFTNMGYQTLAAHGMDGSLFQRSSWYRSLGFQDIWFHERLLGEGLPDCTGAFRGTCDWAIADWIGQRLAKTTEHPQFVYWMTLSSHLPATVPSGIPHAASCQLTSELSAQPAYCSWYQYIAELHRATARVAAGTLARPTILVLVGDHAPPFSSPELRAQFSAADVPYIILIPRRDQYPQAASGR